MGRAAFAHLSTLPRVASIFTSRTTQAGDTPSPTSRLYLLADLRTFRLPDTPRAGTIYRFAFILPPIELRKTCRTYNWKAPKTHM